MNQIAPKRRVEKKALSRQKIIDATVSCIAKHGLAGVTISRICTASSVARGMVNAHFDSKENLLLEVLKSIASDYQRAVGDAVAGAGDNPAQALRSVIVAETSFWTHSHEESCAWVAFRAAALSNAAYMKLCGPRESTIFDLPLNLCEAMTEKGGYDNANPEQIARGLAALLEGLWFDWVSYPDAFNPQTANECCYAYLKAYFPRHF